MYNKGRNKRKGDARKECKMPKIRVEIKVPDSKYCDNEDTTCPMCLEGNWGKYYCCLFGSDLEIDEENQWYCIRCEQCKQAEVEK